MNIINYARATVFNSSTAAFKLIKTNPEKYSALTSKILSVKSEAVNLKMLQKSLSSRQTEILLAKQEKYQRLSQKINFIINRENFSLGNKCWATDFIEQHGPRANRLLVPAASIRTQNSINYKTPENHNNVPNSWFAYLMKDDKESELLFFNQEEKNKTLHVEDCFTPAKAIKNTLSIPLRKQGIDNKTDNDGYRYRSVSDGEVSNSVSGCFTPEQNLYFNNHTYVNNDNTPSEPIYEQIPCESPIDEKNKMQK